jgi:hypothetical protein
VEVLQADGLTGEVTGQEVLDHGGGIEPIEEGGAILVAGEALVELIAQEARKAGDFAVASHGFGGWINGLGAAGDRRPGSQAGQVRRFSGNCIHYVVAIIHYIGHNDNHTNDLCQLFLFALCSGDPGRAFFGAGSWHRNFRTAKFVKRAVMAFANLKGK